MGWVERPTSTPPGDTAPLYAGSALDDDKWAPFGRRSRPDAYAELDVGSHVGKTPPRKTDQLEIDTEPVEGLEQRDAIGVPEIRRDVPVSQRSRGGRRAEQRA